MTELEKIKELESIIRFNKDDRGKTILIDLVEDFLKWHNAQLNNLIKPDVSGSLQCTDKEYKDLMKVIYPKHRH